MLRRKSVFLIFVLLPLVTSFLFTPGVSIPISTEDGVTVVDLGNGMSVEVGPDEVLNTHTISANPVTYDGYGAPFNGSEYGERTDTFTEETMFYDSAGSSTETVNLSIPMGSDWEAYNVYANVTEMTEYRTWINNPEIVNSDNWNFTTFDAPSEFGPTYTSTITSQWIANGGDGDACADFEMEGYYYYANASHYGDWHDVGDKAYIVQDIDVPRGEVVWSGISLDFWADQAWDGNPTGFFELFLSLGDPDNGGSYLWNKEFDLISNDAEWFSTGLIEADTTQISSTNFTLWAGLRVTQSEWYRSIDIVPHGRLDNIVVYTKSKVSPSSIDLRMNNETVNNVTIGSTNIFGSGTLLQDVTDFNWNSGSAYANFSWYPSFVPTSPDEDMTIEFDVSVTVYARRYNVLTYNDTIAYDIGSDFIVENATDATWETSYLASVPGGYLSKYSLNMTIPDNRDVTFLASPEDSWVNLTSGWNLGDFGDGAVNVSAYTVTQENLDGFWRTLSTSPNIISDLQLLDSDLTSWISTRTLRADQSITFNASVPAEYNGAYVTFVIYNPSSEIWTTQQSQVIGGFAVSDSFFLSAANASVGLWEIQAFIADSSVPTDIQNVGFYTRQFRVQHSTQMSVFYPVGSDATWSSNVTYGETILFEFRVNDLDTGELLPGGSMTYSWIAGSGSVTAQPNGAYTTTLDTNDLASNGQYEITIDWQKEFYDLASDIFTLDVYYTTEFRADSQQVDVPRGDDAVFELYFEDQTSSPIEDASITCNWSLDVFDITPVIGNPGYYTLTIETDSAPIDTYLIAITASKSHFESRTITRTVNVRELLTAATPSTSYITLPIGYSMTFNITYEDSDHGIPLSGRPDAINCNWSDIHTSGDLNYTVVETATPGIYDVTLYSMDLDYLGTYNVIFTVGYYGAQNQTFQITVELSTHMSSFSLVNSIDPTPYTGDIEVIVMYYDIDADVGIENGITSGYYVNIYVESSGLPSPVFTVVNGSVAGEYIILIPASQWGSVGTKDLSIYVNWTGPRPKYTNHTFSKDVVITSTPTNIFIDESPLMTPYGEDVSFTIIYYDVGNDTGITNQTLPYGSNVHLFIEVLTSGETLTQADMLITEVDPIGQPGVYRIQFDTSLLTGMVSCELRLWFNWTSGVLPLYDNQTLVVTVYSTYRQTVVDWNPMPETPYDELVNFSFIFRDSLSGSPILNSSKLSVSIQEAVDYTIFYEGDITGRFYIELDTSFWAPGIHQFHVILLWVDTPFYQNRTVSVTITVQVRNTELVHGTYGPIQYANNLTLVFTYRDLDDYTSTGMNGGTLLLDSWLIGYYEVQDNGDGTYTLELRTDAFPTLGIYTINVTMVYGGTRYCQDATDVFYLSIVARRTQLTTELPHVAPYLTYANMTISFTDDNNGTGISNANIFASCNTSESLLVKDSNYFIYPLSPGVYLISIDTLALGTFGSYIIDIVANWTDGVKPFYLERTTSVSIVVSRRLAILTIYASPLNTPYNENATFTISFTDDLDSSGIQLDKSKIIFSHGTGTVITDSEYLLSGSNGLYTIEFNSTVITSVLISYYSLYITVFWGDEIPFYSNASTSTEVTINSRFTQAFVISTPPAYYSFNASILLQYSDYITGQGISLSTVDYTCLNTSSYTSWIFDKGEGIYEIIVDTSTLTGLGKYIFTANFTISGIPYYANLTQLQFSFIVNPVSTILSFELPSGVTYYLGDTVVGNITYTAIETDVGIVTALVGTNWNALYGTSYTITMIEDGIYELSIETSGLDTDLYTFSINASKYLHLNLTITADILISAIPIEIALVYTPSDPDWGVIVDFSANITDARTGLPVLNGNVSLSFSTETYELVHMGGGIYNVSVDSSVFEAGEFTLAVHFNMTNHETRDRDFQIRLSKISATLDAWLDSLVIVNGQDLTFTANYTSLLDGSSIPSATVTYDWLGGTGVLIWDGGTLVFVNQTTVAGVPVGTHYILIQATSDNYKTVSLQLTIEIGVISTSLSVYMDQTIIWESFGEYVNLTVYLENTDLSTPIDLANVTFTVDDVSENMTAGLHPGYYTIILNTTELDVGSFIVEFNADKTGFAHSSVQLLLNLERIDTEIQILTDAYLEGYYGETISFTFRYVDLIRDIDITGANATFTIDWLSGNLTPTNDSHYTLTINTQDFTAGIAPYDIYISFFKNKYKFATRVVKIVVKFITTEIIGVTEIDVPVGDDYSQIFQYNDTLNNLLITDGYASAIWEFGSSPLLSYGNGSYRFGPTEVDISRLEVRDTPYEIRIILSRGNYSRAELVLLLQIRLINTEIRIVEAPNSVFANDEFYVKVIYYDLDHLVPILDASSELIDLEITHLSQLDSELDDGTYIFAFTASTPGVNTIQISFGLNDYSDAILSIVVFSEYTPEQLLLVQSFGYGTILLLALAGFGAYYARVLSVPKMLRWIRKMIGKLRKGRIPTPAPVRDRRHLILDITNEYLEPVAIQKELNEIAESTVEVSVIDTDELLKELAILVELEPSDVAMLRRDLDKMRPSEQGGFLMEVLKQERARRAEEITTIKARAEPVADIEPVEEKLTESDIDDLKARLLNMGIDIDEVELLVEQARNLTKADIDALLEQLGGRLE